MANYANQKLVVMPDNLAELKGPKKGEAYLTASIGSTIPQTQQSSISTFLLLYELGGRENLYVFKNRLYEQIWSFST